jgi:hypothetical protein
MDVEDAEKNPDLVEGNFVKLRAPSNIGSTRIKQLEELLAKAEAYDFDFQEVEPEEDKGRERLDIGPTMDQKQILTKYVKAKGSGDLDKKQLVKVGLDLLQEAIHGEKD